MNKQTVYGHILAISSVAIWSSLYVSSEYLLQLFSPSFLLMLQVIIGLLITFVCKPSLVKLSFQQEKFLLFSSLAGFVFYNLFINLSLSYTKAVNTSFLVTLAPLFVLFYVLIDKRRKLSQIVWLGCLIAIVGSGLINFDDGLSLALFGDCLAVCAAAAWAVYTVLASSRCLQNIDETVKIQRMLIYALPLAIVNWLFVGHQLPSVNLFLSIKVLANLLLVSAFSTAICYLMWNASVSKTSAESVSQYVYLTPIFTVTTAMLFTNYTLTIQVLSGGFLVVLGIYLINRGLK